MKRINAIHIGTSGWHYPHWKGPFYPDKISASDFLAYYARSFRTVEINNSFYRLPSEKALIHWRDTVQPGFFFAVKASRYITHIKKLKDPAESVSNFLDRVKILGKKLGPILFQLPPKWYVNLERLSSFLQVLPDGNRYGFEFRHPSWFDDRVYEILSDHNAGFCIYELNRRVSPKEVTADFVYVRLHGPDDPYQGQYDTRTLSGWAGAFSTWSSRGKEIFCYFDNDQAGYAAQDALKLKEMLDEG
jgi:uncharacterized protein YecE (DUF72 family)